MTRKCLQTWLQATCAQRVAVHALAATDITISVLNIYCARAAWWSEEAFPAGLDIAIASNSSWCVHIRSIISILRLNSAFQTNINWLHGALNKQSRLKAHSSIVINRKAGNLYPLCSSTCRQHTQKPLFYFLWPFLPLLPASETHGRPISQVLPCRLTLD